ncbi:MAG: cation:proton antiporter [Acidobacteriaceae bacterium]|nr:cation:proton antiporter [Acidobacteriaceae bacterium]
MNAPTPDISLVFIELGAAVVGLAILSRLASRFSFSTIPLYIIAGLAFGNGGLFPFHLSEGFIHIGGEIGVVLLLFMLGLEYSGEELKENLRLGLPSGLLDFALNFTPGLLGGLLLRWNVLPSVLLGGVTWVSSSGIIAKLLAELKRLGNPETPSLLSVLVLEDLAMAVYLPLVAALLSGGEPKKIVLSISIALVTVFVVLLMALRYGRRISGWVAHESDETLLLTTFGVAVLVAGVAQRLQVSAAVGAFLVGVALSGPVVKRSERLMGPLRDLFAATFFFFFGLQIDPKSLLPVALLALCLGIVTALTKVLTGYRAAKRAGVDRRGCLRAGAALVARGEFSIVIAGLGAAVEPQLGPVAAAYVLFLAVLGPVLARFVR